MNAQILNAKDRVHVLTDHFEWTILRGFDKGRGPCYISDIRERAKPHRQIVRDGGPGHTINDPQFGGLFGFGLVASLQQDDPAKFWDRGWEITTRGDAGLSRNFGVVNPAVSVMAPDTIGAACTLNAQGRRVADVSWRYVFGPGDQVVCTLTVSPIATFGLFIKEPKVVYNGIGGYRTLTVTDKAGKQLGQMIDLVVLDNPTHHTKQIAAASRYGYRFDAPGLPTFQLANDGGLGAWGDELDAGQPMSLKVSPGYCLNKGKLWRRTEVTRWGTLDVAGLLDCGAGQGGYGAPDCWSAFRPWPSNTVTVQTGALIGKGTLVLPTGKPKPPPAPKPPALPKSIWVNPPWTKKHVYIAYGLRTVEGSFTPAQLVDRLKQSGCGAVMPQLAPAEDPDWIAHTRELITLAHAAGIQVAGWTRCDLVPFEETKKLIDATPIDGFLADVEGPISDPDFIPKFTAVYPDLPTAVIATGAIDESFPGLTPGEIAGKWGDRFDMNMQDYYIPSLKLTPDDGENFTLWRSVLKGVPHGFRQIPAAGDKLHISVIETHGDGAPSLAEQADRIRAWGQPFGVWLGELLEAHSEWDLLATL